MSLRQDSAEYQDGDTQLRGLLVSDDQGAKRPGMLVVHGGDGLDDHAKGRARQLVRLRLVAFACDAHGNRVPGIATE